MPILRSSGDNSTRAEELFLDANFNRGVLDLDTMIFKGWAIRVGEFGIAHVEREQAAADLSKYYEDLLATQNVLIGAALLGQSVEIGPGVQIGDWAVIGDRVNLAEGVHVGEGATIGQDAQIGSDVIIEPGSQIWSYAVLPEVA